jgi:hypothetical protein
MSEEETDRSKWRGFISAFRIWDVDISGIGLHHYGYRDALKRKKEALDKVLPNFDYKACVSGLSFQDFHHRIFK